jgi:hypothetical protein
VRRLASCAAAVLALVLAGCGSAIGSPPGPAPQVTAAGAPLLATSLVTAAGTWAVALMGGSAATHNNFWQLFVRPAGSTAWRLVTPAGVADNGGLVVAGAGGQSLITAFRPSQYLTFTPLTVTRDGGRAWSPAGPLSGGLANVPDALSAEPGTGQLLALLTSGSVEVAAPGYARWHRLASRQTLASTPAGRRCGLRAVTAVTSAAPGLPLLGARCGHPGVAGIFAARSGTWQAVGPVLAGGRGREPVTVLRLAQTGMVTTALLQAGSGPGASLFAAWSGDAGGHWTLSAPLRPGTKMTAASFGPAGTIVLNGTTAAVTTSTAGTWRSLPAVPAGTATVTAGPAGAFDALAVHRARLTVWQLAAGAAVWRAVQVINVPIQYGSSS